MAFCHWVVWLIVIGTRYEIDPYTVYCSQKGIADPQGSTAQHLVALPVQELAPRLVAQARLVGGEDLVFAAMGVNRANFQLEARCPRAIV